MHRLLIPLLLVSACVDADPVDTLESASVAGTDAVVLADGLGTPHALTTDGTHLYWVDAADARLLRMSIDGGAITTLATGASVSSPWSVTVAGGYVFWLDADDGAVRRTPRIGGPTVTLATGQGTPMGIASDGTYVWWTQRDATGSHLRRVRATGGLISTLATGSDFSAIVVDAFFVYAADAHVLSGANQIVRVPRAGGAKLVLSSDEDALGLAGSGGQLFWKRFWTGDVRRGSMWMPGAVSIAPDGGGWGDLDVDASRVWWSTGPLLHRVARTGGAGEVVVETADWINSLAVGGGAVFLAVDDGSIVRVGP